MCFFRAVCVRSFRLSPSIEKEFGSHKTDVFAIWPWVRAHWLHLSRVPGWRVGVLSAPLHCWMLSLPLLLAKTQVMPSVVLQRLNVHLRYATQNWALPKLKMLLNEN